MRRMGRDYISVSTFIKRYGYCEVQDCMNSRTRDGTKCINHTLSDDEEGVIVDIVHMYSLHCMLCPYIGYAKGTKEQERYTRLFGIRPCPKCGGLLTLEDEEVMVGNLRKSREL